MLNQTIQLFEHCFHHPHLIPSNAVFHNLEHALYSRNGVHSSHYLIEAYRAQISDTFEFESLELIRG
jgi:hypothetical protein